MPPKGVKVKKANLSLALLLLHLLTQLFFLLVVLPFKPKKMDASAVAKGTFLQNFQKQRRLCAIVVEE